MKTIQVEFEIGDSVWYITNDQIIRNSKVDGITIQGNCFTYHLEADKEFNERLIDIDYFRSKEDVKRYIIEIIEAQ